MSGVVGAVRMSYVSGGSRALGTEVCGIDPVGEDGSNRYVFLQGPLIIISSLSTQISIY
jgi:hypothetical protein